MSVGDKSCCICYCALDPDIGVKIPCKHDYCISCFIKHMRLDYKCAYCRVAIATPPTKVSPMTEEDLAPEEDEVPFYVTDGTPDIITETNHVANMINIKLDISNCIKSDLITELRKVSPEISRVDAIERCIHIINTYLSEDYNIWNVIYEAIESMYASSGVDRRILI